MSQTNMQESTVPRRIVVGFDASPSSQAALTWALAEARQRSCDLDVVTAWRYPGEWAEGFNEKWADDEAALAERARVSADAALCRCFEGAPPPAWVHVHAVRGSAGRVLVERSSDADLLVVGRRGRGALIGALIGSVSSECVHHASCPVVVMPDP
jgi:nucleotide-binding universal stress UspA family protein